MENHFHFPPKTSPMNLCCFHFSQKATTPGVEGDWSRSWNPWVQVAQKTINSRAKGLGFESSKFGSLQLFYVVFILTYFCHGKSFPFPPQNKSHEFMLFPFFSESNNTRGGRWLVKVLKSMSTSSSKNDKLPSKRFGIWKFQIWEPAVVLCCFHFDIFLPWKIISISPPKQVPWIYVVSIFLRKQQHQGWKVIGQGLEIHEYK